MKRIGILTAGGDTPALNATIFGAVERANALKMEVIGIIKGFGGMIDPHMPHVHLNPLFSTIPELDPTSGGTLLGASRTYIDENDSELLQAAVKRLKAIGIEGLICIGGDGTINGMQPISKFFPSVLAPKTIDNDLGLNYIDEPNEYAEKNSGHLADKNTSQLPGHEELKLEEIINYATPGYATAVFVAVQGVRRIRTTAESHRRIAIIEVMGRQSGYIALGSSYGQPDIILIPEVQLDLDAIEKRVRALYDLQKHVVIVLGEGVRNENGNPLGAVNPSVDPAGNLLFQGAAEELKKILCERLGDDYFRSRRRFENADSAIFTRKIGHTQRGGRPIEFDRFHASQLGGQAVDLLKQGENNMVSTLQWSPSKGFYLSALPANKLRDRWGEIHPRLVHSSLYDPERFQPSRLGINYLIPIFTNAIGWGDMEHMRADLFNPGNLATRYQSVNIDIQKRMLYLEKP
ncbi:6-phosphofructokinase [hydrothermal vent metagenome]|uniref:6-phosphofructokinase n=1 Tax=hydrothermal vent metagenome TaxID=652676 RepID=A0A3B1D888_9ZZZZ